MFKQAYKISEASLRKSQQPHPHNPTQDAIYLRDIHAFIFIRRRLAMCARKLGKIKDAIKIMREVSHTSLYSIWVEVPFGVRLHIYL